jgi:hypothetical protein
VDRRSFFKRTTGTLATAVICPFNFTWEKETAAVPAPAKRAAVKLRIDGEDYSDQLLSFSVQIAGHLSTIRGIGSNSALAVPKYSEIFLDVKMKFALPKVDQLLDRSNKLHAFIIEYSAEGKSICLRRSLMISSEHRIDRLKPGETQDQIIARMNGYFLYRFAALWDESGEIAHVPVTYPSTLPRRIF